MDDSRLRINGRSLRTIRMSSSSSGSGAIAVEVAPSSCTWTQQHNATGHCILKPRSCFNCLNTKPTSGEVCTLTPDGVCMGANAYDPTRDYTHTAQASAYPKRLNFFSAKNATYCEPNDMACASCRDRSFKNWRTYPSQYCEGYHGCVCVSICENDVWETSIQPTLEAALKDSQANGSYGNCSIQEVKTQDDHPTDTGNLADFVGLSASKAIYAGSDQCMWVQNQTYCGVPRSCFDCLNTPIYSGAKCMLHSSGYCTSMDSYDVKKDFRREGRSNNSIALFPGTNTTYCMANDPVCVSCRQSQAFSQWSSVTSQPQFCVGTDGCVCVASCESPLWEPAVVALTCNTSAVQQLTRNEAKSHQLSPVAYWSVSALALLGAMILALLFLSFYRRWQQYQAAKRRRPRSPKGPTLELSGWKAMREKLIETEREFVGETGTMAQLEGRHLRTTSSADNADPEAEPGSSLGSSTAPALVVEDGDAYRPVSPSRMRV